MTFLLSFLASFSGYESWKSVAYSPIWHSNVADASTVCLFASIYTRQINLLSYVTDLCSDANTFQISGFSGLRQLPLQTEHVPEENPNFEWSPKKFHIVSFCSGGLAINQVFWQVLLQPLGTWNSICSFFHIISDSFFHIISDFDIKIRDLWHKIRFLWRVTKSHSWSSFLPLKILQKEMFQFEFFREKFRLVVIFSEYFYLPLRQEINEVW